MSVQNELEAMEREGTYGHFYGFYVLFMDFYGVKNKLWESLWQWFLLNAFMGRAFYGALMEVGAYYGWF